MPSTVSLLCVDPPLVAGIWPHVRALVKSATNRAEGDFDRIESEVLSGLQQLWIGWNGSTIEAAGVTQLAQGICIITAFAATSSRSRWLPLLSVIEDFAKAEGCKAVRLIGRKGWERVLKDFRVKQIVMDKELS